MRTSSKALTHTHTHPHTHTHTHTHTHHLLYLLEHEGVFVEINKRILKFQLFMACIV
jgi:hypothetical protein